MRLPAKEEGPRNCANLVCKKKKENDNLLTYKTNLDNKVVKQ